MVSAFAFATALDLTPVFNNDVWIQLEVGELIRETGRLPDTVLFSYTEARDNPFTAYEWLPSVLWSLVYDASGYTGWVVLKWLLALAIGAGTGVLAWQVRRSWVLSAALASLCLLALNFRTLLRPELIALLLCLVSLNLLVAFERTGRPAWLLALLPTSLVWANTHGSFLVNLALPGLFALGRLLDDWLAARLDGVPLEIAPIARSWAWLGGATLAMAAVSLVNPFGARLFVHAVSLSSSEFIRESIAEWHPLTHPNFRRMPFMAVHLAFSLALLGAMLGGWRRLRPSLIVLLLPFWLLTFDAIRHLTWFVLVGTYVLAHTLETPSERGRSGWLPALATSLLLLLGTAVVAVQGNVRGKPFGIARDTPLTQEAVAFLREKQVAGHVFNTYEYGDQLVYHFWPAVHVAMDSRLDAYGPEHYREHRRLSGRVLDLLDAPDELLAHLDRYGVDWVVSRPFDVANWRRAGYLDRLLAAGFEEIYRDRTTVILKRP